LDECHKLSNDAQNALLKALEDTPRHVFYILCTTDPQKLIPTIKGRCSQFKMNPLSDKDMFRLLRQVVKGEEESLQKQIYDQIVQDSQGRPRNALQILGQVLAVPEEKRLETAKRSAEIQSQVIELCRALVSNSGWKKITNILSNLQDQDAESVRRAVIGYCSSILLKEENTTAAKIMEAFIETPYGNLGFPQLVFCCYCSIQ
jgi:DNA polymerase-3 subunit gamma/tau